MLKFDHFFDRFLSEQTALMPKSLCSKRTESVAIVFFSISFRPLASLARPSFFFDLLSAACFACTAPVFISFSFRPPFSTKCLFGSLGFCFLLFVSYFLILCALSVFMFTPLFLPCCSFLFLLFVYFPFWVLLLCFAFPSCFAFLFAIDFCCVCSLLAGLGPLLAALGPLLAALGPLLDALGPLLAALGLLLGRSWALLGGSWGALGRSWPLLGRSWKNIKKTIKKRCPK